MGGLDSPLPLTASQKEFLLNNNSATFTQLNQEVINAPAHAESSYTKASTSGYSVRPAPALNNVILPGSSTDPAPTCDGNKKVRINEYIEENKIADSELGLENTRKKIYEIIELDSKPSLQRARHRLEEEGMDQNTDDIEESGSSNSNVLKIFRGNKKSKS